MNPAFYFSKILSCGLFFMNKWYNYFMKLKGKKIVIFVEKLFEEIELWYSYYRLMEEGADVKFVGPSVQTYVGKNGYPVKVHASINDIDVKDFDAVVIPGGFAPDYLRRFSDVVDFVKDMNVQGKVVAAICHGVWVLASAEILKGKKVTSYFSIKDDIRHAGADFVDEPVVRDGNIITSRKPDDVPQFCLKIIEALSE